MLEKLFKKKHLFAIMVKYDRRELMKKVLLLVTIVFLLTGCMNIKKSSYDDIVNDAIKSNRLVFKNKTSSGYSYYLPKGLIIEEDNKSNVVLKNEKYRLYLYLDLISYYNKIKEEYTINDQAVYSTKIQNGDKFGYLEINLKENDKYLIEIMYNYAKIEVIVGASDIKETLSYALSVISTIEYKDSIIENMIGEDILNYNENEFNIFETAKNENSLIEYDDNNTTNENTIDVPDTDLINKR